MFGLSTTDVAIALSHRRGALRLTERVGRDGAPYVAIEDDRGLIEVQFSREAAEQRVSDCTGLRPTS